MRAGPDSGMPQRIQDRWLFVFRNHDGFRNLWGSNEGGWDGFCQGFGAAQSATATDRC